MEEASHQQVGRKGPPGLRVMPADTSPSGIQCFNWEEMAFQGDHDAETKRRTENSETVLRCELTLSDTESTAL